MISSRNHRNAEPEARVATIAYHPAPFSGSRAEHQACVLPPASCNGDDVGSITCEPLLNVTSIELPVLAPDASNANGASPLPPLSGIPGDKLNSLAAEFVR